MERLQKVMATAGIASRRKSEDLIREGKVKVNGKTVTELGTQVDPSSDWIEVNGRPIKKENKRYFLFHKPRGVITSLSDERGRKSVADFLKKIPERVYPVGRLDYDSEGLLLLTNDGELANRLTHPRFEVGKTYRATVQGSPNEKTVQRLANGVRLEEGWTAPAEVRVVTVKNESKDAVLEMTIHEGRNRQIRRMCEAVGHPVKRLVRTKVAFLELEGLARGQYRVLTKQEITHLKELVKL
ncbi:23S rRNA pseudouridine2605 synthase [Marininema mesophilum]|uniref:Pseudouridine synthase n=1 Tax=Marininema mesophilum TaxID=1048340 RepID=A0A1H2UKD2_9BACL|nr:pseudouridine synthase [Marininema mesophilum]SDW56527.1 23S rRNA pseudouridine2605 synthase [Marininema mesophilum]